MVTSLLKQVSFFKDLSNGDLHKIFSIAGIKIYAPGQMVFAKEDLGNNFFIVKTGRIKIFTTVGGGKKKTFAYLKKGDFFGEMSLLDSGIRFSACTTLTDCEIAVLSAEAMDDMMTKDPQLAASLIALLARKLSLRLRVVSARLSDNQK